MVTLANGFAHRGFDVDLVLARAEGPYVDEVSKAVRIVDLKASRVLTSVQGLSRYIKQKRPEALLSTLRHANAAAAIAHRLAGSKSRLVLREANHILEGEVRGLTGRVNAVLYRWAYRYADQVVGVSEGVSASVERLAGPRCNIQTIYNPVDIEAIDKLSHVPLDTEMPLADGKVILAVGRLSVQKDYPTLIRAFATVRQRIAAKLIILGEGPERAGLEQLVHSLGLSDDVSMPGFAQNPFAYMRRADLFVLSSRWEGLPNTLIQAMACGTPVVSTDCASGPAEILENGKWGKLVPVGDHEALAKTMLDTLNDAVPLPVKDRAAEFSVDRAVDAYLQLIEPKCAQLGERQHV